MTEQVLFKKFYKAISIDWPRRYTSWVATANPESDRSVERHYKTMPRKHVLAMCKQIKELAHPDGCHVFNWSSGPFIAQSIEEFAAMGARFSSMAFYWIKMRAAFNDGQIALTSTDAKDLESLMHVGMGHTTRKNIEPVLLGRIGSPKRRSKKVRELIFEPLRENSRKPEQFYQRVEEYCEGPYLDLFSRTQRPGWTTWGDEDGKFNGPQAKKERKPQKPREPVEKDPNQIDLEELIPHSTGEAAE